MPEPFYANYNTFTFMSGGVIHPIPTSADNGYRFADRKLIESQINERTRAILVTNPGNPTGLVLTHEEMRVIADVVKAVSYTHLVVPAISTWGSFSILPMIFRPPMSRPKAKAVLEGCSIKSRDSITSRISTGVTVLLGTSIQMCIRDRGMATGCLDRRWCWPAVFCCSIMDGL